MTKNKKLNHRELKTILDKFDELPQEFLQEMASQNSMSIPELKRGLQETCYRIEGLSFAYRRSLRREIDRMGAETIESVERVNRMKICDIRAILDQEIAEHDAQQKKQCAFNKAWDSRRMQIYKDLIKEGVITVDSHGLRTTQLALIHEKLDEEAEKLREEFEASYTGS